MTTSYTVTVQTGPERVESFVIKAEMLSEAWVKGARITNCLLILTVKEVV